jgi:hypothetical protein
LTRGLQIGLALLKTAVAIGCHGSGPWVRAK